MRGNSLLLSLQRCGHRNSRMLRIDRMVGEWFPPGMAMTNATCAGESLVHRMADADRDTRCGGSRGIGLAYDGIPLVPRQTPDFEWATRVPLTRMKPATAPLDPRLPTFLPTPCDRDGRRARICLPEDHLGSFRPQTEVSRPGRGMATRSLRRLERTGKSTRLKT